MIPYPLHCDNLYRTLYRVIAPLTTWRSAVQSRVIPWKENAGHDQDPDADRSYDFEMSIVFQ
jgi:hypothetical protein